MSHSDKLAIPGDASSRDPLGAVGQFLAVALAGGLAATALIWMLTAAILPLVAGLATFALGTAIACAALRTHYPHRAIGACNSVTLIRLALASVLVACLFAPDAAPWAVFSVAALAFALDGVDGWLARRAGLSSAFGARFDMEVDAVLALTLACLVAMDGSVGAYVLILGLPRYAFWAASFAFPWLDGALPERFSRKVVCVLQIGVLLALLLPFVTAPLSNILAGTAVVALIWSFGLDIRWLSKARA